MMRELKLKGDYITLGQLLKAEALVEDGVEAIEISDGSAETTAARVTTMEKPLLLSVN